MTDDIADDDEPLAEPMERAQDSVSAMTWTEVDRVLKHELNVPIRVFLRHTGFNRRRYKRSLAKSSKDDGKFDAVPPWVELALCFYNELPQYRTWENPLPLPFAKWKIDIIDVES